VGALFASVALGGLVYGFVESNNLGWRHPLVIGSLIVGFGCMIAFVLIERSVSSPMVPMMLFESSNFSGANLLTLFLYAAIGIFFFLLPLDLIQVQGYSASATGAAILPLILLIFLLSRWSGGLVARYGARGPLIVGPLIVALGFALFALPTAGNSYWRAYFSKLLVLGFGMSVTVAPLTTVVMNSVGQDRVGAASGINNAVARVAGVLAIAVLGMVMVHAFGSRLNHRLVHLWLPPGVLQQVQAQEIKLAGLHVPGGLNSSTRATIRESVQDAFMFGFQSIMLICSGLSLASAAVAWLMVAKGTRVIHPLASDDESPGQRCA
jgi:MFS family permease